MRITEGGAVRITEGGAVRTAEGGAVRTNVPLDERGVDGDEQQCVLSDDEDARTTAVADRQQLVLVLIVTTQEFKLHTPNKQQQTINQCQPRLDDFCVDLIITEPRLHRDLSVSLGNLGNQSDTDRSAWPAWSSDGLL